LTVTSSAARRISPEDDGGYWLLPPRPFGALADPTRRAILTRLENAGLISRTRRATARLSHLEAEPLRDVTAWLARYQRFWDESHERLDDLLAALQADQGRRPGRPAQAKGNDDE
jgi:hypothetical protein